MYGGAAFSFDGGPYVEGGSNFYEQHIDSVDGKYYSAMQADYDLLTTAQSQPSVHNASTAATAGGRRYR
jgi:hypothetical protein